MIGKKKASNKVKKGSEIQNNMNVIKKELQLKGFDHQLENQLANIKGNLRRI